MHVAPYLLHCHSFKWWSYFFFLPPPFFLGGLFLPPTAAGFTTFSGLDCLPAATWVSSCFILALIVTSSPLLNIFKNSLIIHKEKAKEINVYWVSLYLIKTRLNFKSNFLDQNNPKSKYKCKNELICIRDFEAVHKTRSHILSVWKILGFASCF